jgi:hypothetical protein
LILATVAVTVGIGSGVPTAPAESWVQPYPTDQTYWELIDVSKSGPPVVSGFAWVRPTTSPGERFAMIAYVGPLYDEKGNSVMNGGTPTQVIGSVLSYEFSGADGSEIALSFKRSSSATARMEPCMKETLVRFWHLADARWQALMGCAVNLTWGQPKPLRLPLTTRYAAGDTELVSHPSLSLQLRAESDTLRASVVH